MPQPKAKNPLLALNDFLRAYLDHYRALHRNARLFLISNIIINISTGALIILYALFLKRLGFDTVFQSNLLVVGIVGAGTGLAPALLFANRYSARRLLLWSNIIGGIAAFFQLVAPQALILYLTSFVVGASAAIYVILTPPLLAAASTSAERAHLFSLNATLGLLTGVLGALLGGVLPRFTSLPLILHSWPVQLARPFLVKGNDGLALQLALIIAGLISLPSLWPLARMDDTIIGASPQSSGKGRAIFSWRAINLPTTDGIRTMLASPLARFSVYMGCLGLGAGLFLTYINLYFIDFLHISTEGYGAIAATLTILLAIATLGGPLLAQRMGAVRGPITSQLLAVPLLVILGLTRNVPLIIAVYLARGVLMNIGGPVLQSFIMGCVPPHQRNAASTSLNISWQIMLAIGGYASGYAIKYIGYPPTFLFAAACYLGGMLLLLPWFGREAHLLQHTEMPPSISTVAEPVH